MARRSRKRSRRQLGLSPRDHATEAKRWLKSMVKLVQAADRVPNRCEAVEFYSSAIAKGTVASVQARQALDEKIERAADKFVRKVKQAQWTAIQQCRRR